MSRRLSAAERDARYAEVVALRRLRTPWSVIGAKLGVSAPRAHQIYEEALVHNPLTAIQVDEHRIESTELADLAVQRLMKVAMDSKTSAQQ